MIKSLTLRNFRTHKNSKLEFCPGINGIIGIAQSGKTSIIRAIRLLYSLKPSGNRHVHKRKENVDAFIEIEMFDGSKVSLEKGNKTSGKYIVNGEEFRKFGKNVPEPVANVLNLSDINFHLQFDSPFLAMSKPSEVNNAISKITGAKEFDKWIETTNDEIRNRKANLKILETSLEEDLIQLDAMEGLEDCEPLLAKAYAARKKRIRLQNKLEMIEDSINRIKFIEEKISRAKQITKIKPFLKKLDKINKIIFLKETELELIENYLDKNHLIDMSLEDYNDLVEKYCDLLKRTKTCPTCLSHITKSAVKKLSNEFSPPVYYDVKNGWIIK